MRVKLEQWGSAYFKYHSEWAFVFAQPEKKMGLM